MAISVEEAARRLESARLRKVRAMNRIVLTVERFSKKRTPVDTGTLRRSHTHRVMFSGERGVVGTNIKYSRHVHDGTKYMAGRPYYEEGLRDSQPDIGRINDDMMKEYLEELTG